MISMRNRSNALRKLVLIGLFVCLGALPGYAQDGSYWTLQYGTRSTLLGGAVIGSVSDLGATFYNPGMLGLYENPSFLLTARIYQLETVTARDAAGQGIDISNSKFGGVPSLAAGSFRIKPFKGHFFAYSLLSRQRGSNSFTVRQTVSTDIFPNEPGDELFAAEAVSTTDVDDFWVGFTWSYAPLKEFSLGVTQFLSIRSQTRGSRILAEAVSTSNKVATGIFLNEFDYKAYSLLWKFGLGWQLGFGSLGLTLTTPNLHLSGSGTVLKNDAFSGLDTDGDGVDDGQITASLQTGVPAQFKYPLAVGFGGAVNIKKSKVHFSAEWYDSVAEYTALEAADFVSQTGGDTVQARIKNQLNSVFNFGMGVELYLSERFTAYASAVTDYSAAIAENDDPEDTPNASTLTWDLVHIAGGAAFIVGPAELTLGLQYAGGKQNAIAPIDFGGDVGSGDPIIQTGDEVEVKLRRWKFIFGFSVNF